MGEELPLLLIHGLMCSGEQWFAQVAYFTNFCQVITYDLRGHGQSPSGNGSFTINEHVDDIVAWLSGMNINDVTVVGSSIGGWIALEVAARLVTKVRALVLVGSCSRTVDDVPELLSQIDAAGSAEFLRSSIPPAMFSIAADPCVVNFAVQTALAVRPDLVRPPSRGSRAA